MGGDDQVSPQHQRANDLVGLPRSDHPAQHRSDPRLLTLEGARGEPEKLHREPLTREKGVDLFCSRHGVRLPPPPGLSGSPLHFAKTTSRRSRGSSVSRALDGLRTESHCDQYSYINQFLSLAWTCLRGKDEDASYDLGTREAFGPL
jgi:hypothetical protein